MTSLSLLYAKYKVSAGKKNVYVHLLPNRFVEETFCFYQSVIKQTQN